MAAPTLKVPTSFWVRLGILLALTSLGFFSFFVLVVGLIVALAGGTETLALISLIAILLFAGLWWLMWLETVRYTTKLVKQIGWANVQYYGRGLLGRAFRSLLNYVERRYGVSINHDRLGLGHPDDTAWIGDPYGGDFEAANAADLARYGSSPRDTDLPGGRDHLDPPHGCGIASSRPSSLSRSQRQACRATGRPFI